MNAPSGAPALRWGARWRAAGWLLLAIVVVGSLLPLKQRGGLASIDKVEHLVGYALLMFWFAALHPPARRVWFAIAFVALGAAIEWAQVASGWRKAELYDFFADAAGVALGWAAARVVGSRAFLRVERVLGDRPERGP